MDEIGVEADHPVTVPDVVLNESGTPVMVAA